MKALTVKINKNGTIKSADRLKNLSRIILDVVNYGALPLAVLVLWELLARGNVFSPALLPPIQNVLKTFGDMLKSGELISDLSISLIRVLKGYGLALFFGITFGLFMGISERTNKFFTIVFDAIRQIPPMAWIPLIILWFGIGEASKIVIIFKAAFFPILLNTINGIKNTPKGYIELARLHNVGKLDLLRKIYFPSAAPSLFVGLRLGLGTSWMTMVAAELIASSSGIGYRINDGRELSQPDLVIVGMIVIGVVGVLMDVLLKKLAKTLLKWKSDTVYQ